MEDIKEKFFAKLPDYLPGLPALLPELLLLEITFACAEVAPNFEQMETVAM